MGVGPGPIRVLRAAEKKEKAAPAVWPKKKRADAGLKGQQAKAEPSDPSRRSARQKSSSVVHSIPKGVQRIAPRSSPKVRQPGSQLNGSGDKHREERPSSKDSLDRVKVCLLPSKSQQARLTEIFAAPKVVAGLLKQYPRQLTCPSDASMFLLQNKKALDGYISPQARNGTIDLLTELLLHWSAEPPEAIGINFQHVGISPAQEMSLPVHGLRAVPIVHPSGLAEVTQGFVPQGPFTLFEEGRSYYLTFTLARETTARRHGADGVKQRQRPPRERRVTPEIRLRPGDPLPYIVGLRQEAPRSDRVLYSRSGVFPRGLKTMNWAGLSGWAVSGGLPSLGRRSR